MRSAAQRTARTRGDAKVSREATCELMTMTTPPDARMATEWRRAIERGELPMITIYERPDEFPDEYVARLWLMRRGVA